MDLARYQNLHPIHMSRDLIHKWWRRGLRFASKVSAAVDCPRGPEMSG